MLDFVLDLPGVLDDVFCQTSSVPITCDSQGLRPSYVSRWLIIQMARSFGCYSVFFSHRMASIFNRCWISFQIHFHLGLWLWRMHAVSFRNLQLHVIAASWSSWCFELCGMSSFIRLPALIFFCIIHLPGCAPDKPKFLMAASWIIWALQKVLISTVFQFLGHVYGRWRLMASMPSWILPSISFCCAEYGKEVRSSQSVLVFWIGALPMFAGSSCIYFLADLFRPFVRVDCSLHRIVDIFMFDAA